MARRVHEIAKEHGVTAKELLSRLQAAGVEVKSASSNVDDAVALRVLGDGADGSAAATAPSPSATATAPRATPATPPAPKVSAPAQAAPKPQPGAPAPAAEK